MLSYQHAYHAGNYSDVLKHIVLCAVVEYMKEKEKGFYFHDTHAGRGLYPLNLPEMEKLHEYEQGIGKLWPVISDEQALQEPQNEALRPYAQSLRSFNPGDTLTRYPGSCLMALELMRRQDRAFLTDLHPVEFASLEENADMYRNVSVKRIDAWQGLKAGLPPQLRRGVILIDPSYELKDEYQQVVDALKEALVRFKTGTYLIWYPLLATDSFARLVDGVAALSPPSLLQIETLFKDQRTSKGMIGSGMLVINPPWTLHTQLDALLPSLCERLGVDDAGSYCINWLIKN